MFCGPFNVQRRYSSSQDASIFNSAETHGERGHDHQAFHATPVDVNDGMTDREMRRIQEELSSVSDDFKKGKMQAFGPNTGAVFAALDEIRDKQEALGQAHIQLGKTFNEIKFVFLSTFSLHSSINSQSISYCFKLCVFLAAFSLAFASCVLLSSLPCPF